MTAGHEDKTSSFLYLSPSSFDSNYLLHIYGTVRMYCDNDMIVALSLLYLIGFKIKWRLQDFQL